jgi:hypothetical protein
VYWLVCADFRWGFVEPGQAQAVEQAAAEVIRDTAHAYGSVLRGCTGDAESKSMGLLLAKELAQVPLSLARQLQSCTMHQDC